MERRVGEGGCGVTLEVMGMTVYVRARKPRPPAAPAADAANASPPAPPVPAAVSASARARFIKPKSSSMRSSFRRSSPPLTRNATSRPSLPCTVRRLGLRMEASTSSCGCTPVIIACSSGHGGSPRATAAAYWPGTWPRLGRGWGGAGPSHGAGLGPGQGPR